MIPDILELIAALREELKHYGEMLSLLDQQEQAVSSTTASRPYHVTTTLQQQAEAILEARRVREHRRRALARELRQDESATVLQLMPLLPPQFRPLLQSLVEENNDLFQSVQRAARENQELLHRSVQSMSQFLNLLFPTEPVAA